MSSVVSQERTQAKAEKSLRAAAQEAVRYYEKHGWPS